MAISLSEPMLAARSTLTLAVLALLAGAGATGCAASGPSARSLHYVDDVLVHSPPAHHQAYAAYLRARLAMDGAPADFAAAEGHLQHALRVAPHDAHLWTTLAELELRRGDRDAALTASRKALAIRPGYAPARQLLVRLEGEGGAGASASLVDGAAARP